MTRINSAEVIWNEVDGDIVALAFSTGSYFVFNNVGSHVWKMLDQGKSNAEIVSELRKLYDIPVETLESDVNEFIDAAASKNFIAT